MPHKDRQDENASPREDRPAGSGAADSTAAQSEASGTDALSAQIQKLLAEKQELTDTLVRRQADFENYRKRIERERHQDHHRGVELFAERILPVLDAFGHALAADAGSASAEYRKGFELIERQLNDVLAKQGLVRMETAGKQFDPHFHHAIEQAETSEYAEGAIIGELQAGYLFHGKVLRPAMVRVATAPEGRSVQVVKRESAS
ncbi:MAG TPA: nucleotide exchange factor GrpE [Candidatus Acidoferrales bacterium]|nr:nucleotide exchange factor GrpE [Candidatus Acidoferrales bacterium]